MKGVTHKLPVPMGRILHGHSRERSGPWLEPPKQVRIIPRREDSQLSSDVHSTLTSNEDPYTAFYILFPTPEAVLK